MFRHILAPVDFSAVSAIGLRHAAALAGCGGARLSVLFADPFTPPPYFTSSRVEALEAQFRESVRDAESRLDEFLAQTIPGQPAQTMVLEALPVDAILSAVEALGADLVAMGTHGRGGFDRWMLGSVTEKVLRRSPVPVLTVGESHAEPRIRRILAPVNDTGASRDALARAAELGACLGASVTVLHVREAGAPGDISDLCAWVPAAQRARCEIREITRQGQAAEQIVQAAAALASDLVVLGARHRPFADTTVLGATTARVVRHAPCAVLTVLRGAGAALHSASEALQHAV